MESSIYFSIVFMRRPSSNDNIISFFDGPVLAAVAAVLIGIIIIFGDRRNAASFLATNHGTLPNELNRPKEGGGESFHTRGNRSVLVFDSIPVISLDDPHSRCHCTKAMEQQVCQFVGDGEHESEKPASARNPILAQPMRIFSQGSAEDIKQSVGGITYSVERGGDCLADSISPPPGQVLFLLYKSTEKSPVYTVFYHNFQSLSSPKNTIYWGLFSLLYSKPTTKHYI